MSTLTINDMLLAELQKRGRQKLEDMRDTLAKGRLASLDAYKSLTGEIRGVEWALKEAEDALDEIKNR